MPETIIGVVAHNNEEVLDPCLRSLHAFTSPGVGYALMDNGSEDATGEMFDRFQARYQNSVVIKSPENLGCNQGWNLIFDAAKQFNPNPKYLILINSDVQILPRPHWDRELIETIETSGPMTATAEALGVIHYPGGPLQHVGSAAICYRFDALFELWAEEEDRQCQTGPWDVANFPGWEGDLDLFNALRRRGYWPSLATQGVHVLHLCGATECKLREGEEFLRYQREAQQLLAQKWAGTSYREEWWGKRQELGAIETRLAFVDPKGAPRFYDNVDETETREMYPWL